MSVKMELRNKVEVDMKDMKERIVKLKLKSVRDKNVSMEENVWKVIISIFKRKLDKKKMF
jgi:hypothetical protein